MPGPYVGVRAISRSQNVRIAGQKVTENVTTYVDLNPETTGTYPRAYPPVKELRSHLAIGAIIVVEPLTWTTSDWAVQSGLVVTSSALAAKKTKVVVSPGDVEQRSTGLVAASTGKASTEYTTVVEGKERIDIFTVAYTNDESGASKEKEGTAAVTGKAVQPETEEEEKLVTYAKELEKAEITQKEYNEKVAVLPKELVIATITYSYPTGGSEERPVVTPQNRA